jgi:PqqD family protein of HPr-rel-A system
LIAGRIPEGESGKGQYWGLVDKTGTLLHFFDDGCAVFNPTRWETHVVDLLVGTVLEALASGPRPLEDLTDAVTSASDLDAIEASRFVAEALPQLVDLSLVEPAPDDAAR